MKRLGVHLELGFVRKKEILESFFSCEEMKEKGEICKWIEFIVLGSLQRGWDYDGSGGFSCKNVGVRCPLLDTWPAMGRRES